MTLHTGENVQGLKKITDMTRLISIAVLLIHCYYNCYTAFAEWKLTNQLSDHLLKNINQTGLLSNFMKSKLIALEKGGIYFRLFCFCFFADTDLHTKGFEFGEHAIEKGLQGETLLNSEQ